MKKITTTTIAEAFTESMTEKSLTQKDERVREVMNLITRHKGNADKFLEEVENLLDKNAGIIHAKVTTKESLNTHARKDLEKKLLDRYGAKGIKIEEVIDENILGGIKVKVGDEVYDETVAGKLNSLKNLITK